MNHVKNFIVIPEEDYTDELQKELEDLRNETLAKLDAVKAKYKLKSLGIAHAYVHGVHIYVNSLIINHIGEEADEIISNQ